MRPKSLMLSINVLLGTLVTLVGCSYHDVKVSVPTTSEVIKTTVAFSSLYDSYQIDSNPALTLVERHGNTAFALSYFQEELNYASISSMRGAAQQANLIQKTQRIANKKLRSELTSSVSRSFPFWIAENALRKKFTSVIEWKVAFAILKGGRGAGKDLESRFR